MKQLFSLHHYNQQLYTNFCHSSNKGMIYFMSLLIFLGYIMDKTNPRFLKFDSFFLLISFSPLAKNRRIFPKNTSFFLRTFFELSSTLLQPFFDKKVHFPSILEALSKKCRTKLQQTSLISHFTGRTKSDQLSFQFSRLGLLFIPFESFFYVYLLI